VIGRSLLLFCGPDPSVLDLIAPLRGKEGCSKRGGVGHEFSQQSPVHHQSTAIFRLTSSGGEPVGPEQQFLLPWQCITPHIDFSMDSFAAYAHLSSVDVQVQ